VATNPIGVGWAAPTIYLAGSDWQHQRFLDPIFRGDEYWCQLFSEPDSGSDLASLATRAVRDGDEYVLNGSKIWTSGAHHAHFGILIARTDPDVPKHKGLSYFIVPMDLPGVRLASIVDMTTAHSFNQVFFDDVRLPARYRVGAEGDGWRLAKVTLANERVSLSSAGSMWGTGPSAADLLELVRAGGGLRDAVDRQRAAALYIESEVMRLSRLRTLSAQLQGRTPGAEASIQKIMGDEHGQHVMELAKHLSGSNAMLTGSGPAGEISARAQSGPTENRFGHGVSSQFPDVDAVWHYGFLFSPALTIGGGTSAIQRNIVAEHVLGLPRDIDPERGLTWSQTRQRGR
jgi:alkylation response protein AidB-like acyl-CoA dehydrogenase